MLESFVGRDFLPRGSGIRILLLMIVILALIRMFC